MKQVDKITTSIMALQIANNLLTDLNADKIFKQSLKNKVNNILPELVAVEVTLFDRFFDLQEQATNDVYQVYQNFIAQMSQIPIYDCDCILAIYEAYKKNPKSLEGIVNKILKE